MPYRHKLFFDIMTMMFVRYAFALFTFGALFLASTHASKPIKKGLDESKEKDYDKVWLHKVSENDGLLSRKYRIPKRASINTKDKYHYTPLHDASWNGHVAVVEYLALQGAVINAKEKNGHTPLWLAKKYGRKLVVDFLFPYKKPIAKVAPIDLLENKMYLPQTLPTVLKTHFLY